MMPTTGFLFPRQPALQVCPWTELCALDFSAEQGEGHGAYMGPSSFSHVELEPRPERGNQMPF